MVDELERNDLNPLKKVNDTRDPDEGYSDELYDIHHAVESYTSENPITYGPPIDGRYRPERPTVFSENLANQRADKTSNCDDAQDNNGIIFSSKYDHQYSRHRANQYSHNLTQQSGRSLYTNNASQTSRRDRILNNRAEAMKVTNDKVSRDIVNEQDTFAPNGTRVYDRMIIPDTRRGVRRIAESESYEEVDNSRRYDENYRASHSMDLKERKPDQSNQICNNNGTNDLKESKYLSDHNQDDEYHNARMKDYGRQRKRREKKNEDSAEPDDDICLDKIEIEEKKSTDPTIIAQNELIERSTPSNELETALFAALKRKEAHVNRLANEILKLTTFISKRKQTYKRKRKDDGAPIRPLSAYNIFIQDRFARLAQENEQALKSDDADAHLQRVPPADLVAVTGNQWKELPESEKKKYEERAKKDRDRYEMEMAEYDAPDKQANRKRNKSGYNMFFSAHVLRLKQTESGVPSERGSVARLVGTAWKNLPNEEKAFYEREADKHNGMNPVKEGDDDDEDEEIKQHYHLHGSSHTEGPIHASIPPPMNLTHPPHDPRHHHPYYGPHHLYVQPPYNHYDYSQHHQRHQQARAQGFQQAYPSRHPYEGM